MVFMCNKKNQFIDPSPISVRGVRFNSTTTGNDGPRLGTYEEIIAKYKKNAHDASSVADQARNKLLERQEKLEKISKRTQDLSNEAEEFAALANELVKTTKHRKWWHI